MMANVHGNVDIGLVIIHSGKILRLPEHQSMHGQSRTKPRKTDKTVQSEVLNISTLRDNGIQVSNSSWPGN
jgi:hypothetical protein